MKRRSSFLTGSISDALCPAPAKTSRLEVVRDEPGINYHTPAADVACSQPNTHEIIEPTSIRALGIVIILIQIVVKYKEQPLRVVLGPGQH